MTTYLKPGDLMVTRGTSGWTSLEDDGVDVLLEQGRPFLVIAVLGHDASFDVFGLGHEQGGGIRPVWVRGQTLWSPAHYALLVGATASGLVK